MLSTKMLTKSHNNRNYVVLVCVSLEFIYSGCCKCYGWDYPCPGTFIFQAKFVITEFWFSHCTSGRKFSRSKSLFFILFVVEYSCQFRRAWFTISRCGVARFPQYAVALCLRVCNFQVVISVRRFSSWFLWVSETVLSLMGESLAIYADFVRFKSLTTDAVCYF